ncbi:UNVERIFIED_CONTAM: hypothetical protein HDU68_004228 [Siphonaria sp. JEL0065]|nr:hypothetical protein HDU68_004228 [Siphonaria sp. JEL0065]
MLLLVFASLVGAQLAIWPTPPLQTSQDEECGSPCTPVGSTNCAGQMFCNPQPNDESEGVCMDSPWAAHIYNWPLECSAYAPSLGDGFFDPTNFPDSCVSDTIEYQGSPCDPSNADENLICCLPGESYAGYSCSPPIDRTHGTLAVMTNNDFTEGGSGGGLGNCIKNNQWPGPNDAVVALSTGWFNGGSRCLQEIYIYWNGKMTTATVVDECDSRNGCDSDHSGQRPCQVNVVDASNAVCEALGCDSELNQYITWSDTPIDPNGVTTTTTTTAGPVTGITTAANNAAATCTGSASSVTDLAFNPTAKASGNSITLSQAQGHGQSFTVSAVKGCGSYAADASIPVVGISTGCGFSIAVPSGCEIQVVSVYNQFSSTAYYTLNYQTSGDVFVGASIDAGSNPVTPYGGTLEILSLVLTDAGMFTIVFTSTLTNVAHKYEVALCVGQDGVTNGDCTSRISSAVLLSGATYAVDGVNAISCSSSVQLTLSAYEGISSNTVSSAKTVVITTSGCGASNTFTISPAFGTITVKSQDGTHSANQDITFTLPASTEVWINALAVSPGCTFTPSSCHYITIPPSCFSQTSSPTSASVTIFSGSTGSSQAVTTINPCPALHDLHFVDSADTTYEFDIHWTTINPGSNGTTNGNNTGTVGGLTSADIASLLSLHNNFRAQNGISQKLTWNSAIGTRAYNWAKNLATNNRCQPVHGDTDGVGQNLASAAGTPGYLDSSMARLFHLWDKECISCGEYNHATQVLWATTTTVGCGIAFGDDNGMDCVVLACDYMAPGNMIGDDWHTGTSGGPSGDSINLSLWAIQLPDGTAGKLLSAASILSQHNPRFFAQGSDLVFITPPNGVPTSGTWSVDDGDWHELTIKARVDSFPGTGKSIIIAQLFGAPKTPEIMFRVYANGEVRIVNDYPGAPSKMNILESKYIVGQFFTVNIYVDTSGIVEVNYINDNTKVSKQLTTLVDTSLSYYFKAGSYCQCASSDSGTCQVTMRFLLLDEENGTGRRKRRDANSSTPVSVAELPTEGSTPQLGNSGVRSFSVTIVAPKETGNSSYITLIVGIVGGCVGVALLVVGVVNIRKKKASYSAVPEKKEETPSVLEDGEFLATN